MREATKSYRSSSRPPKCTSHFGIGLVAISARHNRSKGARGPENWRPPDEELWCQYAKDWTQVKTAWKLTMTGSEAVAVVEMLGNLRGPGNGYDGDRREPAGADLGSGGTWNGVRVLRGGRDRQRGTGFRATGAEVEGFRKRWCHPPVMGTGMEWIVKGENQNRARR